MTLLRIALFSALFVCFSLTTFSQNKTVSSLRNQLRSAEQNHTAGDTTKAVVLNELALAYISLHPDSTLYFAKRAYHASGETYLKGQLIALNTIARAYYANEKYSRALSASQQAYSLSKTLDDKGFQCSAINNIGLIYLAQNDLEVALDKFKEAAALAKAIRDEQRLAAIYLNIGICYNDLKQPALALPALEKSLFYSIKLNKVNLIAVARNRMGEVYRALHNLPAAIHIQNEVIIDTAFQDAGEYSYAYAGLAKSYFEQGDYKKAIFHAKKALVLADQATNRTWEKVRATEALSMSYAGLKDFKNAYQYLQVNIRLSNKLVAGLNAKEINGLHLRQELSLNRELLRKNLENKEKLERHQMIMVIIASIALLMIIIFYLLYRNYLQKKRLNIALQEKSDDILRQRDLIAQQNLELSELNRTKDQLFSVIGHDLRNPFASILQTLELLREEDLSADESRILMDSFFEKVSATSAMLDNLLHWANSHIRGIHAHRAELDLPLVIDQQLDLMKILAMEKKIMINHQKPGVPFLVLVDEGHIRIIIQNLVGNAIKFTPEHGLITIGYKDAADGMGLSVTDHGVGMSAEKLKQLFTSSGQEISTYGTKNEKGIGIGLVLVKKYLAENEASLHVKSEVGKGTCFTVIFKGK